MASFELSGLDGRRAVITCARGLEAELSEKLASVAADRLYVIHDPTVGELARRVADRIGAELCLATAPVEGAKRLAELERLAQALLEAQATRASALVVIGGGTILDLGAFLAGVYMRGIACVLLPTSFLAIVDAAVGGKSAVDLGATKNILGLIRQPDLVLIDPDWLETLPDLEFRQGIAEVIKMAAMLDAEEFAHLEAVIPELRRRDAKTVEAAAISALKMKSRVVQADEREAGQRMFLNFGHTLGHAIESLSGFKVAHGDAVAMGMVGELEICDRRLPRLVALLADAGLPLEIPQNCHDLDALWEVMSRDKKRRGSELKIAVPSGLGVGDLVTIEREDLDRLR